MIRQPDYRELSLEQEVRPEHFIEWSRGAWTRLNEDSAFVGKTVGQIRCELRANVVFAEKVYV